MKREILVRFIYFFFFFFSIQSSRTGVHGQEEINSRRFQDGKDRLINRDKGIRCKELFVWSNFYIKCCAIRAGKVRNARQMSKERRTGEREIIHRPTDIYPLLFIFIFVMCVDPQKLFFIRLRGCYVSLTCYKKRRRRRKKRHGKWEGNFNLLRASRN